MPIWEKLGDESDRAFQALQDYYELGARRSQRALIDMYTAVPKDAKIQPPTRSRSVIVKWSTDHRWKERIRKHSLALNKEKDEIEKEIWTERRRETLESDYQLALKLRAQVEKALEQAPDFIYSKRQTMADGTVVIRVGMKWGDIVSAAKAASELQRAAAKIPNKVDITSDEEKISSGPTVYNINLPSIAGVMQWGEVLQGTANPTGGALPAPQDQEVIDGEVVSKEESDQ